MMKWRGASDPDSIKSVDPNPDSVSGSGWAKMTHKNRKKFRNIMCVGYSLLRAAGFSCILDVLYGGLGIIKIPIVFQKN
jgi:hypothetical protein